jgi:hypothetical protein
MLIFPAEGCYLAPPATCGAFSVSYVRTVQKIPFIYLSRMYMVFVLWFLALLHRSDLDSAVVGDACCVVPPAL